MRKHWKFAVVVVGVGLLAGSALGVVTSDTVGFLKGFVAGFIVGCLVSAALFGAMYVDSSHHR